MDAVRGLLRRVRLRLLAAAAVEDLQLGLAWGGGTSLAVLALSRFGVLSATTSDAFLCGAVVATAWPIAGAFLRRTDDAALAAQADRSLGLRERVSTALWCAATGEDVPMAGLVVADADAVAARVVSADLARAIRPRVLRRPLVVAGVAVAASAGLLLWQPAASALESPEEKTARLLEQDRVAQVARKLEAEAKRIETAAEEKKETALAKLAAEVRRAAQEMQRETPQRAQALTKLNQIADKIQTEARKKAGLKEAGELTPEASEADKQLEELLRDLAQVGLETLQKDLSALEKRLKDNPKGDGAPNASDLRALAARMDALRQSIERAEQSGASDLVRKLRSIGNEDLLEKIAERMRNLAAKMDQPGYEGLESDDAGGESSDLSEMSREELEELLKQLEELASMEDLSELLRQGGQEARGGKKLRLGRSGGT